MVSVRFVDTSVLLNILDVPGFAQDHEDVMVELGLLVEGGITLILPTASIIETGNHVRHVVDGNIRREAASRFDRLMEKTIASQAPWELNRVDWSASFLATIRDGSGTGISMIEHAVSGLGVGDLTILAEAKQYRDRTKIGDVRVWSLDAELEAHQ